MKYLSSEINNCFIISQTYGIFSFKSFKTIQFIINQNKKLYKKIYFKKIPNYNKFLLIKPTNLILEFVQITNINDILLLIKKMSYKLSFKFKILYLKK